MAPLANGTAEAKIGGNVTSISERMKLLIYETFVCMLFRLCVVLKIDVIYALEVSSVN